MSLFLYTFQHHLFSLACFTMLLQGIQPICFSVNIFLLQSLLTIIVSLFSGVDIISILETLHFNETVINSLKDSSAGYIAIAYALYKIFTPIRYTVTLGKL